MRVYVGAPIDTSKPEHPPAEQFQELITHVARGLGYRCIIYNPYAAFENAGHPRVSPVDFEFVVRINEEALTRCNLGVFVWNGSPSYGVPNEIETLSQRAPVVILNLTGKPLGLYLRSLEQRRDLTIVDNVESLLTLLQEKWGKDQ